MIGIIDYSSNSIAEKCAINILKMIKPYNVIGKNKIRKGRNFDGGYVILDDNLSDKIIYSFGINDDVSFDLDLAALGCSVFQYDHTINSLPINNKNFLWRKIGISDKPIGYDQLKTIDEIIIENGHINNKNLFLKMDIEGFEWGAFINSELLSNFSQIVVELHSFHNINSTYHYRNYLQCLQKLLLTHTPIHIHANNYGGIVIAGGTVIPDVLEVTLVRKQDHEFQPCYDVFPTSLDMPCNHITPDIFLGALGCL